MSGESQPRSGEPLSQEIIDQLVAGPGLVNNPAAESLAAAADLPDLGNFNLHFDSGMGDYYRQTPHYRRFAIIYPARAASLELLGEAIKVSRHDEVRMNEVYEKMRALVDINDPGVLRDGSVDRLFLTH